jgi:hypothetical protein
MGAVLTLALIGGGAALGLAALVRRRTSQRTEALQEMARRLGWAFQGGVEFSAVPDLERFELFRSGRSKALSNLVTSPAGARRAIVFDYTYVTGSGNAQRRHRQTVFYATREALDLPSFSLRPESFLHRVAGLVGYQDIDFERRPEFSRLFLLRGENEAGIRAAFDTPVLRFFEQRPGTCAAGIRNELLFWRPGGYASPEEVEALIREGEELAELISRAR